MNEIRGIDKKDVATIFSAVIGDTFDDFFTRKTVDYPTLFPYFIMLIYN
jgi:hypothetical protein